jgi:hypothetical protein
LLSCVDEGRNPDTYFVNCALDASAANQARRVPSSGTDSGTRKFADAPTTTRGCSLARAPPVQATKGRVGNIRALCDALTVEALGWTASANEPKT